MSFSPWGLECKSRKSRYTWGNRQAWPWSTKWSRAKANQSILKEISFEYPLERLMLKLKLKYLATWCEELTHWKRPWGKERLKARREGGDRGWDGWMASLTPWTWVWASSGSWSWTGNPGVLLSMGLKELEMTEWLNWTEEIFNKKWNLNIHSV